MKSLLLFIPLLLSTLLVSSQGFTYTFKKVGYDVTLTYENNQYWFPRGANTIASKQGTNLNISRSGVIILNSPFAGSTWSLSGYVPSTLDSLVLVLNTKYFADSIPPSSAVQVVGLDTVISEVSGISTKISTTNSDLGTLNTTCTGTTTAVGTVNTTLGTTNSTLSTVSTNTGNTKTSVDAVNTTLGTTNTNLTTINTTTAGVTTAVNNLSSAVAPSTTGTITYLTKTAGQSGTITTGSYKVTFIYYGFTGTIGSLTIPGLSGGFDVFSVKGILNPSIAYSVTTGTLLIIIYT